MPTSIDTSAPKVHLPARPRPARWPARAVPPGTALNNSDGPLTAVFVTSVTAHLLAIGLLGFGVGGDVPARPPRAPVVPPTTIEEKVDLQPPPPEDPAKVEPQSLPDDPSVPSAPAAATIDLPPLPALSPITAVPSTVPVAFAIAVKGPVRLTNDPSRATGAVGGRGGPVSLDADGMLGKNLLLPPLRYPAEAIQHRITGSVEIEFRIDPGSVAITNARVRRSSGFSDLDRAALQNLRQGHWLGSAGYYVKSFAFVLN
jgi:TonB family protein